MPLPLNVLPAPRWTRQDDLIYVSTLFPIDSDGNVVRSASISPHIGDSEVAAQTRALCAALGEILAEAGSSLELTLKAEVYLVDANDFYEFKLAWKEAFPEAPPARLTAICGDDHVIPGVRLSLVAVAAHRDAAERREIINIDTVPDPMDAEWCPQAVKAEPFVFMSGYPATDFETGIPVKTNPVAPFYASDTELQARYMFDNWAKVLEAAGSDMTQCVKTHALEIDLHNFHDLDGVWDEYMGHQAGTSPPTRASMAMPDLLVPGAIFVANAQFIVPDETHRKVESRKGIAWHPEDVRKVHFTPGIDVGEWFFMAGQVSCPDYENFQFTQTPKGLPHYWSDIEVQVHGTMELLKTQLAANELDLTNVVDARVFLCWAQRDYRGFERAWREIWEPTGHLPTLNLIPSNQASGEGGIMMPELLIEIDLIAHRSRAR